MDTGFEVMLPIFVTTLGPLKTIPAFHALTLGAPLRYRSDLAFRSSIAATIVVGFIALVMSDTMEDWQISHDAIGLAGALILFVTALRAITNFHKDPPPAEAPQPVERPSPTWMGWPTLSPLAVPVIVTPAGVAAILFFLARAGDDSAARSHVLIMLGIVMLSNLVGMLLAKPIMTIVRPAILHIIGWIFCVLQAGLAVQAIINTLPRLHIAS
jgi:multiple antibiotic resistance protein